MTLLALDTALARCSAAVLCADGRLVARSEELGRGHAERLADMIAEAMAEAGADFSDLRRIAVTIGPGSFTGLRVALSVARGLALVQPVEFVGVTTLAAIAAMASAADPAGTGMLAVALPARHDEIYAQMFAPDGTPVGEPQALAAQEFAWDLPADTRLAGAAAPRLADLRPDLRTIDTSAAPDITAVARLGQAAAASDEAPVPLYLRPPDAKPQTRFRIERAG